MTPEEAARVAWVYHPSAEEPPPWPEDFKPELRYEHGRKERRLAIVFGLLAALAVGFGIGIALP